MFMLSVSKRISVVIVACFELPPRMSNVRTGTGHPPDHYVEFSQRADKVMVWVGLTRTGVVLGPHFIEKNLASREYLRIIRYNVIQRDFLIHNIDRHVMWWQQDGAPCHTSNATMQYLRGHFPG